MPVNDQLERNKNLPTNITQQTQRQLEKQPRILMVSANFQHYNINSVPKQETVQHYKERNNSEHLIHNSGISRTQPEIVTQGLPIPMERNQRSKIQIRRKLESANDQQKQLTKSELDQRMHPQNTKPPLLRVDETATKWPPDFIETKETFPPK
ncbi:5203_t:CDS:2 [Ambispora gerdemannii]|uniref:5203_t:CDS:1 n=1 Tax=Ambispora gerdemannii TaxID=144530 RepID=A0A9N9B256_9GLOM|nr:5203_t:CDS:2 [Ambispora gerdemannii]